MVQRDKKRDKSKKDQENPKGPAKQQGKQQGKKPPKDKEEAKTPQEETNVPNTKRPINRGNHQMNPPNQNLGKRHRTSRDNTGTRTGGTPG